MSGLTSAVRHLQTTCKQQQVLSILEDTFGAAGAKASAWQTACKGIPDSTFYDARKHLMEKNMVTEHDQKYFPTRLLKDR